MSDRTTTSHPRRRWFRFGLRSLLVFTALVGLLMGWIVKERRQSAREMEIANKLEKSDCDIFFAGPFDSPLDNADSKWRQFARQILGDYVSDVRIRADVQDITPLIGLSHIRRLSLYETPVRALAPLADLRSLTQLDIVASPVTDLWPLAGLTNLEWLSVVETDAKSIIALSELTKLEELDLSHTPIADGAPLANLINLTDLDIYRTHIDDVSPLAKLRKLETLNIAGTRVKDLRPLFGIQSLKSLTVGSTQFDFRQLIEFEKALPNCNLDWIRDP